MARKRLDPILCDRCEEEEAIIQTSDLSMRIKDKGAKEFRGFRFCETCYEWASYKAGKFRGAPTRLQSG